MEYLPLYYPTQKFQLENAIITFLFPIQLNILALEIRISNAWSQKVAEKAGFSIDAKSFGKLFLHYTLTREAFLNKRLNREIPPGCL